MDVFFFSTNYVLLSVFVHGGERPAPRRPARPLGRDDSTVYAFTRLVRYLVWIVGTLIGLNYLGFDLTSLAFLGGAIGVGIGFGLQNIFSNFISGIIILVEKTLKIGDFVDLQSGVRGTVTEIAMRYTRITTNDSVDVLVPNSEFINGRVTNWTFNERSRRIRVPFGVAYGSDKDAVREAGLAAAKTVKGLLIDERHPADVRLVNFGDSTSTSSSWRGSAPTASADPAAPRRGSCGRSRNELTQRGSRSRSRSATCTSAPARCRSKMASPAPAATS